MSERQPERVLILGGGFGGLYAALELEKALTKRPDIDVTFVNRDNFFLFTPMLHEVAASDVDLAHISNPIRKLLKRVRFFHGEVETIDLEHREVLVSHGDTHHRHTLGYDRLIVALGSVTNFYGLEGLEERALTMKSLSDAIDLRGRLIQHLEEADFECAADLRGSLLTVVVAGGGFAGVETVAAVNDFLREAIASYPSLRESMLRVVLVHAGDVLLPELSAELGRYAEAKMTERGVETRLGCSVAGVTADGVRLSDGTVVPARTLVWTAGTSPNPLLENLPCPKDRGRLVVNEYLEVAEWPGVWALGDCALVPDLTTGTSCPPTAQHALRQGKVVAHNVLASIRGGQKKPFRFATLGQLATIGRRVGVAQVFGFKFSGFIAWWLWRTIYLSKLPRFEKKLRVALDWSLDLLFAKDLVQLGSGRDGVRPGEREAASVGEAEGSSRRL